MRTIRDCGHPVRSRRRSEQGFTLIELLVVIAVLTVLAAIVIFNVTGVTNRGSASACATDVKSVQSAVDSYINDHTAAALAAGAVTAAEWNLLVPAYLHTQPTSCATFTLASDGAGGYNVTGA
jgi:prepilin-type N-terminal cleavage/methylation domain-containing protein